MGQAEDGLRQALQALGFTDDPEMARTASRFAELLSEFRPQPDQPLLDSVSLLAVSPGASPVLVRDMAFHSLCAHHLVPFLGTVDVGYLPQRSLAGLGGIARVVHHFARRPQVQERLAEQVADALAHILQPRALVVRVRARQLCMELTGARTSARVEVLARRGATEDALVLDLLRAG